MEAGRSAVAERLTNQVDESEGNELTVGKSILTSPALVRRTSEGAGSIRRRSVHQRLQMIALSPRNLTND